MHLVHAFGANRISQLGYFKQEFIRKNLTTISVKIRMNENLSRLVDLELSVMAQLIEDLLMLYRFKSYRPPFWKFLISDCWAEIQEFIYKAWIDPTKLSSLVTETWLLSSKGLHIRCKVCISVSLSEDKSLPLALLFAFLPLESSSQISM
jgi:hypothetical protein